MWQIWICQRLVWSPEIATRLDIGGQHGTNYSSSDMYVSSVSNVAYVNFGTATRNDAQYSLHGRLAIPLALSSVAARGFG